MISAALAHVVRVTPAGLERGDDAVAAEEPLEIQVECGSGSPSARAVSITMRTPGDDIALAAGLLYSEGVIRDRDDIASIRHSGASDAGVRDDGTSDIVKVELRHDPSFDLARLERRTKMSSIRELRGKTSREALRPRLAALGAGPVVAQEIIQSLPQRLRRHHSVYDRAGGLHAAALFDPSGRLLRVHEDVGRHNAVDKLIGAELLGGALPRSSELLFVTGRASFELVQKALMAGVPIVASLGAPSSLAVELARQNEMTLIGFVGDGRFNVYSWPTRVEED